MIVDSIYFKGHTCFKNEWSGFDTVKPINVRLFPTLGSSTASFRGAVSPEVVHRN